jgi:hypothetical protein
MAACKKKSAPAKKVAQKKSAPAKKATPKKVACAKKAISENGGTWTSSTGPRKR